MFRGIRKLIQSRIRSVAPVVAWQTVNDGIETEILHLTVGKNEEDRLPPQTRFLS